MAFGNDLRERLPQMSLAELDALENATHLSTAERDLVRSERASRADDPVPGSDLAPVSVVVRDFDMPFTNMMLFMVKWAIASIPAVIILLGISLLTAGLLIGFIREFR